MPARYEDWLRQAKRDLEHAKRALDNGDYEWACFAAQQSAEKGVKALFLKANRSAWGHSVAALLQQLPAPWQVDEALINAGKELDKHYIPPRYPNSHPQGAPYDYYTHSEAERAISHTADILAFCERLLAESGADSDVSEAGRDPSGGDIPGN
jgi:HEPN domain-containing protein